MKNLHLLLLVIVGAALLSSVICSNSLGPTDCCFKYYPRRLKRTLVTSYDFTDIRCAKTGVVLLTQKGKSLCVDPELAWVQSIMKDIDEKSF